MIFTQYTVFYTTLEGAIAKDDVNAVSRHIFVWGMVIVQCVFIGFVSIGPFVETHL